MRSRPPKGAACPAPDNIRQRFARGVAAGMAGAPGPIPRQPTSPPSTAGASAATRPARRAAGAGRN